MSGQDTWLFDPKRGLVVFAEGSHDLVVTTTIRRGGESTGSATAKGIIRTRSVLTEFNGVKLGSALAQD